MIDCRMSAVWFPCGSSNVVSDMILLPPVAVAAESRALYASEDRSEEYLSRASVRSIEITAQPCTVS